MRGNDGSVDFPAVQVLASDPSPPLFFLMLQEEYVEHYNKGNQPDPFLVSFCIPLSRFGFHWDSLAYKAAAMFHM